MDHEELGCREFESRLLEAERRPFSAGTVGPALECLCAHVRACSACRARHGSRLAGVECFSALRARAVPDGLLDGMGEKVLARARHGGSGGGMSAAFLDAPQSLARWRHLALAASLLVAVGGGMFLTGRVGWREAAQPAPRGDGTIALREGVLEAWDVQRTDDPVTERVQTVSLPSRGVPGYWGRSVDHDHLWIYPVPPAPAPAAAPSAPAPAPLGK
jgi:hypothetical protein